MRGDNDAIRRERQQLLKLLSPDGFIDVAATIGAFNVVDRIANATGIPLDPMIQALGGDLREQLDLGRFASSANTPAAG